VVINDPTLPLVSIVTPSYNQGRFIRETIESVLNQDYPNIEYWVIDGGSTDETLSILREYDYDPRFHWISEKDKGQSDAINKGFCRCRGEILAWINSDDIYLPQAFYKVIQVFTKRNSPDIVYGNMQRIDQKGVFLEEERLTPFFRLGWLTRGMGMFQQSIFWTKIAYNTVGGINPKFTFSMDTDLLYRFAILGMKFSFVRTVLACYREHPDTKTSNLQHISLKERSEIFARFPEDSPVTILLKNFTRLYRIVFYIIQGDSGWLFKRLYHKFRTKLSL
jgi:glycosyltransferase involved in cell wall biosynthesis